MVGLVLLLMEKSCLCSAAQSPHSQTWVDAQVSADCCQCLHAKPSAPICRQAGSSLAFPASATWTELLPGYLWGVAALCWPSTSLAALHRAFSKHSQGRILWRERRKSFFFSFVINFLTLIFLIKV